jgi:hypothetical protein
MFSTFSGFSVLCLPCKWNLRLQQFGLNFYERTIDSRGPYPEVVPWKMPSGFFRKSAFLLLKLNLLLLEIVVCIEPLWRSFLSTF